ncbi:hypothetical protein WG66_002069 [Moniliophthora roreri]|nr:hypothetical protein WG66_002069 [Moniliophthora roreri]
MDVKPRGVDTGESYTALAAGYKGFCSFSRTRGKIQGLGISSPKGRAHSGNRRQEDAWYECRADASELVVQK